MNFIKNTCLALAAAAFTMTGTMAQADADADANARLAFSDKLSMYSQRIVSSACALTAKEAPFESRGFLAVAGTEINRILTALERGDRALGISSAEENENILKLINEMERAWVPSDALAQTILRGDVNDTYIQGLEKRIDRFTQDSFRLVSAISSQYSDTDALHLSDAIRIQIAGRQRMLAQKLSFEACTFQKTGDAKLRETLKGTIQLFDLSAFALRHGMPEAGLVATVEPDLVQSLDKVGQLWSELKWPLLALENGAAWDVPTQTEMYLKLNELTHEMDKTVVLFTKTAKRGNS